MNNVLKEKAKELADQLYAVYIQEFMKGNLKFEDCTNKSSQMNKITSMSIGCSIIIDENGTLTAGMESISINSEGLFKHNELDTKWDDEA